ncbi:MAG: NUDIX domain-containing protein [Theionarchaea archaeon]|nr:NUDIX domain-containing protein [Theionarchaea archaeon]
MMDIREIAQDLFLLEEYGFDVSTGLLITYNGNLVFVIQNPDRWITSGRQKEAGVVGVGGKLEHGETVVGCVKRECKEEICTDVEVLNSEVTYIVTDEYVDTFTLGGVEKPRPYCITRLKERDPRRGAHTVVFSYKGEIDEEPIPGDVSAVLLAEEATLRHLWSTPTTVKSLRGHSTEIIERIRLPDDLRLVPCGTLLTYLKLKYWHNIEL